MPIPGNSHSAGKRPTTPTIGSATAGNANASVAFTESTYIGKGTITYTATSNPGNVTGSASSTPITVSSLTNGTTYTFSVVGTTNYGVSSGTSNFTNPVTPISPGPFFPPYFPYFPFFPDFPPTPFFPFFPFFSDCTDDDAYFCNGCDAYAYQYSPSNAFTCTPRLFCVNGCWYTAGCDGIYPGC
jgi:hypothetical protein